MHELNFDCTRFSCSERLSGSAPTTQSEMQENNDISKVPLLKFWLAVHIEWSVTGFSDVMSYSSWVQPEACSMHRSRNISYFITYSASALCSV
jgi:hypothetical protein